MSPRVDTIVRGGKPGYGQFLARTGPIAPLGGAVR